MKKSDIIKMATEIVEEVRKINYIHNQKTFKKIEDIKTTYFKENQEIALLRESLESSKISKHMIHGLDSCAEYYLNENNKLYKVLKNSLRFTPPRVRIEDMIVKTNGDKKHIINLLTT